MTRTGSTDGFNEEMGWLPGYEGGDVAGDGFDTAFYAEAAAAREYARRYGEDGQAQRERALKQLEGTGYEGLVMQGLQAEQNSAYREKAAAFLESFMKGEYIPDVQLGELWQSAQAWKRQRTQAANRQDTAVQTSGANTAREGLNPVPGTAYNESMPNAAEGLTVGESLTEGNGYASAAEMPGERAEGAGGAKNVSTSSAEDVNNWWKTEKGYNNAPYKQGTIVEDIQLTENTKFVRVYDGEISKMYGSWVMEADDIKGLTPPQIQNKFALPRKPKYICDVEVSAGTNMRKGIANEVPGWGVGGGKQYDLKGQMTGKFGNERPLE